MASTLELSADFDTLNALKQNPLENPEKVNAASQAAIASATGTKPNIERPQDTSVTLEQGIFRADRWLRDAEVRELTGEDEEALAKVGGNNWARFLDTIVSRGTVHVGGVPMSRDLGDELLIGDREKLMIAIRVVTFGEALEIEGYPCPECGEKTDLDINLRSLPRVPAVAPGEGLSVVLKSGSVAKLRYPVGADQRAIYADLDGTIATQNTLLLSRCLESVDDVAVPLSPSGRLQNVKKLGMADRRLILREMFDSQPGPRLDRVEYTHDACGAVIKLPLALGDMFLWV